MNETFNRISDLCERMEITVTELCRDTGISRGTMTDFKKGRTKSLSAETLDKIANYFDTTVDYLLARTDDPLDHNSYTDPANWDGLPQDFIYDCHLTRGAYLQSVRANYFTPDGRIVSNSGWQGLPKEYIIENYETKEAYLDFLYTRYFEREEKHITRPIFAQRLKNLRLRNGKDVDEICFLLKMNSIEYCGYEVGIQPSMETACRLARLFQVTEDYLNGLTDDPKGKQAKKEPLLDEDPEEVLILRRNAKQMDLSERKKMMGILKAAFDEYDWDDDNE